MYIIAGHFFEWNGFKHPVLRIDRIGWQPLYNAFALHAISDEVLNGNNLQVMGSRYFEQLGKSRHGAVRVQNLYQHTGGIKPGKSREVNSRFRMSAAAQYTTCFRL